MTTASQTNKSGDLVIQDGVLCLLLTLVRRWDYSLNLWKVVKWYGTEFDPTKFSTVPRFGTWYFTPGDETRYVLVNRPSDEKI